MLNKIFYLWLYFFNFMAFFQKFKNESSFIIIMASSVAGYVILFTLVIGMMFILISSHTEIISNRNDALSSLLNNKINKMNTDFDVIDIYFSENNVTILLKNVGSIKLNPENIFIFKNEKLNVYTSLLSEYNLVNPLLWDPQEILNITYEANISKNFNESITIIGENAKTISLSFMQRDENATLISASKTSGDTQDLLFSLMNEDIYVDIDVFNTDTFLYSNFSFLGDLTINNLNLNVKHFMNDSILTKDLDYFENVWKNIGVLSNSMTLINENFSLDPIKDINLRIRYNNDIEAIAYIDKIEIEGNVTRWWIN